MVRNLVFAVLFGVLFYVPLAFSLVPNDIPTYLDSWWLLLGLIGGLLVLRWFTDLTEKAHRMGGRVTGRMMGQSDDEAAADAEAQMPSGPQTYMQMLLGLVVVGPYLALGLAVIPVIAAIVLAQEVPFLPDPATPAGSGPLMILIGVIGFAWFKLLEVWGRVKIAFPIIPIPMWWVTPLAVAFGLFLLFTVDPASSEAVTSK